MRTVTVTVHPGDRLIATTTDPALAGIVFEWAGGAYVEFRLRGPDRRPVDVFNVWDYETDTPTIPRTEAGLAGFVAALDGDDIARIDEACAQNPPSP